MRECDHATCNARADALVEHIEGTTRKYCNDCLLALSESPTPEPNVRRKL